MKKFYLNLIILIILLPVPWLHAETVSFTTYIPSPVGAFDRLRLPPRADLPLPCDIGTIYIDESNIPRFCQENGQGELFWEFFPGIWTQEDDNIYPDDSDGGTETDNFYVGIGTTTPQFKLTLDQDGGILAKGRFGRGDVFSSTVGDKGNVRRISDTRFMWYPRKAAFRAGSALNSAQNDLWGDTNIGDYSIAMGLQTVASATSSIALGYNDTATGSNSIALGNNTLATGISSTTSGSQNNAVGDYSYAGGINSSAHGVGSVAIGNLATANADNSFSFGNQTITAAAAQGALAAGTLSQANGANSFAAGNASRAQGQNSFASGLNVQANGDYSVAIGNTTVANGLGSIAIGSQSGTNGDYSVAFGNQNAATAVAATAMGVTATASGGSSIAMGENVQATGPYSVALGGNTVSQANHSVAIGFTNSATGNNAVALGSQTIAHGASSVAMGSQTIADGDASFVSGSNCQTSNTASYATAIGHTARATGQGAVSIGNSTLAQGNYSVAIGDQSQALGDYSVALGNTNVASGEGAVALGEYNVAAGQYSFAFGRGDATGHGIEVNGNFSVGFDLRLASTYRLDRNNTLAIMGNVGIGTARPRYPLEVNGQASNNIADRWNRPSDARLKKNIRPLDQNWALNKILKLRGVSFKWKEPKDHGDEIGPQIGFIAQDVEKIFPQWVLTDRDGYKNLEMNGIDSVAVESLRALNTQVHDLREKYVRLIQNNEQRLKEQQKKIEDLKKRLEKNNEKHN